MCKNILIIGNGFDIACGLPTQYTDFLNFSQLVEDIFTDQTWQLNYYNKTIIRQRCSVVVGDKNNNYLDLLAEDIYTYVQKDCLNTSTTNVEKIYEYLHDNIWSSYFRRLRHSNQNINKKWVDFEDEIKRLIRYFDELTDDLDILLPEALGIMNFPPRIEGNTSLTSRLEALYNCRTDIRGYSVRDIKKLLYNDLQKFILAFEMYLCAFVDNIKFLSQIEVLKYVNFDYIVTFNYTHAYKWVVENPPKAICHIHGECKINRKPENNNMVLGIDEYWDENDKNKHTNYVVFKKYAQRILKKTDISYITIIKDAEIAYNDALTVMYSEDVKEMQDKDEYINIYVFGHSLSITDKDVLSKLFNIRECKLKIFAHSEESKGELISNLVSILGVDEVTSRASSIPCRLEFVDINR